MSKVKPDARGLPTVFLKPGSVFIAEQPTLISTVLGSCISVCIHSPRMQIGAMNHSLLPYWTNALDRHPFYYVDKSISYMIQELNKRGLRTSEMVVKLFGGADVIEVLRERGQGVVSAGSKNIEAARTSISKLGLHLQSEQVGGFRGYKLWFYSDTGEVLIKRLKKGEAVALS